MPLLLLLLLLSPLVLAGADVNEDLPAAPGIGRLYEPRYRVDFHTAEKPFLPDDPDLELVAMTDKDGDKFQCYLPKAMEPASRDNDSGITLVVGVEDDSRKSPEELLDILKGTCFHKNEGWWTYEFCFPPLGSLRQFHVQLESKKETQGFVLGKYDAQATARLHEESPVLVQKDPRSQTAEQKYYAFMYTNGTKCDLTGEPRETEVRFVCSDTGVQGVPLVSSIKEAATCKYTMIFDAPMLCRHPMFQEKQQPWLVVNCNAMESKAADEEAAEVVDELPAVADEVVPVEETRDQLAQTVGHSLVPVVTASELEEVQ